MRKYLFLVQFPINPRVHGCRRILGCEIFTVRHVHVLNRTWASPILLIDDQESVAGFYILITVSARYWSQRFSNMVDSDLCNILHLHSSFLYSHSSFLCQTLSPAWLILTLVKPLLPLLFAEVILLSVKLFFPTSVLLPFLYTIHLFLIFDFMFSLTFGGLFFILIVQIYSNWTCYWANCYWNRHYNAWLNTMLPPYTEINIT